MFLGVHITDNLKWSTHTVRSLTSFLLAVSLLSVIRPTTVVSSANLVLVSYLAMQSWMNREFRRGLSTHPWGAPVLRISVADLLLPSLTTKSRIQLQREGFSPRNLSGEL